MKKLLIRGGQELRGSVATAGSKNAVLPILAASILTRETVRIEGAPHLSDVQKMLGVLRLLGAEGEQMADGTVEVSCAGDLVAKAPWEEVRTMRGSVCVLGPLLARQGRAQVALPGGCVFGVRPIDVHLKGLAALGAEIHIEHGDVVAVAKGGRLKGATMYLGSAFGSSVLGTANVMMAATLAEGQTVIHGAACEPEIVDLADCLIAMGAKISGHGSPILTIDGVDELSGCTHRVIPDRIEAGTYVIAGAMTGGQVRVDNCRPDHLTCLIDRLWEADVPFDSGKDWIETKAHDIRDRRPRPTDVSTNVYPGFPTDLQAQWMALMTQAEGLSIITERIYPDRWMHLPELERLGAEVRRQNTAAIVRGHTQLSGAEVTASDLRASAALVLAGLVAEGQTEVHRVYHIDRGYEQIEKRFQALGADVRRVDD